MTDETAHKTDIPSARKEIELALSKLEAPFLGEEALDECIRLLRAAHQKMTRTPRKGRRQAISARMTSELALAIAADIRANPSTAYQVIGDRHGVLGARISEMLKGGYDHMLPAHLRFAGRTLPGNGPRFKLTGAA